MGSHLKFPPCWVSGYSSETHIVQKVNCTVISKEDCGFYMFVVVVFD